MGAHVGKYKLGCTLALLICLTCSAWGTVFTNVYDTATPVGTDAPSTLDDHHRLGKSGIQERMNVDHYWALTGTQVSDAATGEHRKISFHSPISTPSNAADKGFLYMKDFSSVVELTWLDESGNELQITSGGALNITEADLLATLTNNTYFTAVDFAGTGTVDLIKADANDVAVVPDNSQTATNAAPTSTTGIANKKYVDDQVATVDVFGSLTTVDSDSQTLLKDHGYLVGQDGMVHAYAIDVTPSEIMAGYNGPTQDPVGAGTKMQQVQNNTDQGNNADYSISFAVASGRYFEITLTSSAAVVIWQPFGSSGGNPVDQD